MAKLAGSAATKITELRKALDAAQQEVKLLRSRHLQTENSKLRRENEALRAILDSIDGQGTICLTPPATGRSQSFISPPNSFVRKPTPRDIERRSSPIVRPSKATTRSPAKPATEATMTEANSPHTHTSDVARSATIHGQKYVYRRGELLWLDERQASVLDQPYFMQPTHASNEKKSSKQPFDYLRKKVRPANYSRYDSRSSSGTQGSRPSGSTESWSSWDTVGREWGAHTQSVEPEETPNTSDSDEIAESTEEPYKQPEFRLHECLDEDLKYMLVPSAFGFLTLETGLKLAQVVFWEQARLHWPTVFEDIKVRPAHGQDDMGRNVIVHELPIDQCPETCVLKPDIPSIQPLELCQEHTESTSTSRGEISDQPRQLRLPSAVHPGHGVSHGRFPSRTRGACPPG